MQVLVQQALQDGHAGEVEAAHLQREHGIIDFVMAEGQRGLLGLTGMLQFPQFPGSPYRGELEAVIEGSARRPIGLKSESEVLSGAGERWQWVVGE
jgi:hypothetical protein